MQLRRLIPHRTPITMVLLALGMAASSGAWAAAQEQPSAFRVAVDLVPVDVQVLDRQGHPVVDLTPGEFDVTINGRRRRVISAALISDRSTASRENQPTTTSAVAVADGGRVIVIAIDCLSISVAVTRGATDAAREFINRLSPADRVGLFAYPIGPRMDPTTDHAAVIRALGQVVGQRENMLTSLQFQLRPSELLDLSEELARGETEPFRETTPGGQVARRECGESLPPECVRRLIQDVNGATLYYEGEATASVGTLRGLLREMGSLTGRKTLVLVTGGMIASDRPGVRPDVSNLGHQAGREAALANTAVYTLHIDVSAVEHVSARRPPPIGASATSLATASCSEDGSTSFRVRLAGRCSRCWPAGEKRPTTASSQKRQPTTSWASRWAMPTVTGEPRKSRSRSRDATSRSAVESG